MRLKSVSFLLLTFILLSVLSCSTDSLTDDPNVLLNRLANCTDQVISGTYQVESSLGNLEKLTVKVEVMETGTYQISTNTVNGYTFSASGNFTAKGIHDVVLLGSGVPEKAQTDMFTISYGGVDCTFSVTVSDNQNTDMSSKIIVSTGQPFQSDHYYVYAVDGNGKQLWSKQGFGETAAITDDIVYLNINGDPYALNVKTGEEIWSNELIQGNLSGAVTLFNDTLYCSSKNGTVYALDVANGMIKWSYETEVSAVMCSTPSVANDILYVGAPDGNTYAINTTGGFEWNYQTNATDVRSSPALANGKVYVGADNGKLYALSASDGTFIWDYDAGISGEYSPTVVDNRVFIQSEQAIYCLDGATGALVWDHVPQSSISDWSSPTVHNDIVYVTGINNGLQAIDATNGTSLWNNKSFGTATNASPTLFEDVVYLAAPGGLVAINSSTGETLWNYGAVDPWKPQDQKTFYTSPVVYDTETKTVGYPSDSGNKQ